MFTMVSDNFSELSKLTSRNFDAVKFTRWTISFKMLSHMVNHFNIDYQVKLFNGTFNSLQISTRRLRYETTTIVLW